MRFMPQRAAIVARREYLAVVKRKAFVLTLVGIPAFYALLIFVMTKPAADEAVKAVREFKSLGVVDSSGLYAAADSAIRSSLPIETRNKFKYQMTKIFKPGLLPSMFW